MDKKKSVKQPPKKVELPQKPKRDYHTIFLWIAIIIVSFVRYRLIATPFERDEGEYAYIGNLLLHGVAPFKGAYSMKLPGTSFMYAILMFLFGRSNSGVHLGVIFINATIMFFLFKAFKKIFNPFIALSTASIYGFMAFALVFDGFAAHATHFICFYSSFALWFIADYMRSAKTRNIFLSGLMFGLAFIMKQQAIFLILFGGIFLLIYLKTQKKITWGAIIKKLFFFGAGVFIPYIIVVVIIALAGQFSVFWLWTVEYASKYESIKSLQSIILLFNSTFVPAWSDFYYLWILTLLGLLVLYMTSYSSIQKLFAILFFIASACVVSAGFYFRPHYFVVLLPAVGLMTGIFIEFIVKQIRQRMNIFKSQYAPLGILLLVLLFNAYHLNVYYFKSTPRAVTSIAYWGNPFNQAQEISKFIADNTKDTDKIAVLGSEPEIYFYANRMAATGYLYTYPLVENQPYNKVMQLQMIKEIEQCNPVFVVFCNIPYSWLVQPGSPNTIFDWGNQYTHKYYDPVGFAEFFKNQGWQIFWGSDMSNAPQKPDSFIIIFKRKSNV